MDHKLYYSISKTIQNFKGLSKDCNALLKKKYPDVKNDTLESIVSSEYLKRMKRNYSKSDIAATKYYRSFCEAVERGESPGIILRIAEVADVNPCLIAKLILLKHYQNVEGENEKINVKKYLRDTTLIKDMDLSYEVYLCTIYDDLYSPIVETMKNSLGQQYEIRLYRELTELGVAFRNEQDLRRFGYDKTPDVKLEIPIAIDGFVIHWIESKALFGDEDSHMDYIKNQYFSYWNRFGPGLVIYWFGFVETIISSGDKKFIIRDHLPKNIVTLNYL